MTRELVALGVGVALIALAILLGFREKPSRTLITGLLTLALLGPLLIAFGARLKLLKFLGSELELVEEKITTLTTDSLSEIRTEAKDQRERLAQLALIVFPTKVLVVG